MGTDLEPAGGRCRRVALEAGKAASRFQFSADGHTFNRQQIHQHCLDQAERYDRLAVQGSKTGRHDRDVGLFSGGVIVNQ